MEGTSGGSWTGRLKTATGVADPVLVRLRGERGTFVLLASDMTHDKAGHIELHGVRFARSTRGIRDWFAGRATGSADHVTIKTAGKERIGVLAGHPYVRVPDTAQGFRFVNLSRQQFIRYRLLSDRRFLRAGSKLERVPGTTVVELAVYSALKLPGKVRRYVAARLLAAAS
jgi:hypothetical protein